jgi:class I fructose-bisphosphate aldolase
MIDTIKKHLGDQASLLDYQCTGISKDQLHLPGPDFVDRVVATTDRSPQVMASLQRIYNTGRMAGTGFVSILPVDQGIEHSGAASFAPNPIYFDPAQIVELALEGGCNAVASTLGVLGAVSRTYAHKIPFLVKINHNEMLTYPNDYDQTLWASVEQAWNLGAAAVGATIYYGSDNCRRQIMEISDAFQQAHELGMVTVLWCYLRNSAFKKDGTDYHAAADLTGQANHLGVTIEADIIKQKQATNNGGYTAIGFGKTHPLVYEKLVPDNPIELTRWQVVNCYMGRAGLINSGGASGDNDLAQAVTTAVINKRAGGMGLISGRKSFQKPMAEGVTLLNAIQDVFLCEDVTVALVWPPVFSGRLNWVGGGSQIAVWPHSRIASSKKSPRLRRG